MRNKAYSSTLHMLVSVISLCLPVLPLNKQQHVLGYNNGLYGLLYRCNKEADDGCG